MKGQELVQAWISQVRAYAQDRPLLATLSAGAAATLLLLLPIWLIVSLPFADEPGGRSDRPVSAETTLLLADVRQTVDRLRQLEREQEARGRSDCARCVTLTNLVTHFETEVREGVEALRALEHGNLAPDALSQQASTAVLQRQRQVVANRLTALDQFGRAAVQCGSERLCRRDDAERESQTNPFECARDRQSLRQAAARISALSQTVIVEARRCRQMTCPIMACGEAAALVADLTIAEQSLAQLAGGQIALHQASQDPTSGGLAVIVGQLEGAIARLVRDTGQGVRMPSELAESSVAIGEGLSGWLEGQEGIGALPRDGWRASALLAELSVASEHLGAAADHAVSEETYEALAAALLDATRFQAAIASRAEQPVTDAGAGPVCGVDDLASAYLDVGRALSAIGFCQRKAACPLSPEPGSYGNQNRSASAPEISAFAAVTGALPLEPERSNSVRVLESRPPQLTTDRNRYKVGEVISVQVDPAPSACLRQSGVVSLRPLGSEVGAQRYQITGAGDTDLMFGAAERPGEYVVQVFGDAARGGVLLSEAGLSIEPSRPGCSGFTGLWETNFGRLRLVERDGRITGSYRRTAEVPLPGVVLGEVSGRTLRGTWMSELGRGGTRLRLSSDGNSFSGTWGLRPERHDGAGAWRGTCLGAAH